jgi:hypothetical protein
MATIPKSAKLNIEDFADAPKEMQPTLQKISTVLNPFLGDVKRGLEGKLTPAENLVFAEKVVTVRTPAHVYTAPTFLNSWVNFDTATYNAAGYRIDDDGRVWLRGLVKDGLWAGNAMFRLPVGYRPAKQLGSARHGRGRRAGSVHARRYADVRVPGRRVLRGDYARPAAGFRRRWLAYYYYPWSTFAR